MSQMRPLLASVFIVFCESMCFTTSLAVVHDYVGALAGDAMWIGLMFALVSGPKVFAAPLWGTLSDRYGRRPILAVNTVGTLTASVLWAAAPTMSALTPLLWLAVSRVVLGVFGGQAGLTMAVAADVTTPERRAAGMGLLGAAFGAAFTLGPPIGGWIGARFSNEAVGWFCAGLQALSLLTILFFLPETARSLARPLMTRPTLPQAFRDDIVGMITLMRPAVVALLVVTLLMTLGQSFVYSTLGEFSKARYGLDRRAVGYGFGLLGLVVVLVQGGAIRPLVRRYGETPVALVGFVITIAGLVAIGFSGGATELFAATAITGVGIALSTPCISGLLSRSVDETRQGTLNGLNQATLGLGRAGGSSLGGALLDRFPTGSVVFGTAAAIVAGAALLLLGLRAPAIRERRSAA